MRTRIISAALTALTAIATATSARSETNDALTRYQVTVRQVEGINSVPAHMSCDLDKVCRGMMSTSAAGGHMRVFVTGMIEGGNAYFRFRAEERDLSCGRPHDFVHLALGQPPTTAHVDASLCDEPPNPSAANDELAAEPPLLKNVTPPLATLRIDVRSHDSER